MFLKFQHLNKIGDKEEKRDSKEEKKERDSIRKRTNAIFTDMKTHIVEEHQIFPDSEEFFV